MAAGVIALCRTSATPAAATCSTSTVGGRPLYQRVAEMVAKEWTTTAIAGWSSAPRTPDELAQVREAIVGDLPILVPGIGAQGGDLAAAVARRHDADGRGLVVSSSRAILYAGSGDDFADAARSAALAAREPLLLPQ